MGEDIGPVQQQLRAVERSGALGPMVTQRLASYMGEPVRCTCRATSFRDPGVAFQARTGNVVVWLRLESPLVSVLADAMIGGHGDPSSVGFNTRVMRLAACAALEFIRSISQALGMSEPTKLDVNAGDVEGPGISGQLAIGSHERAWKAGLHPVPVRTSWPATATARVRSGAATASTVLPPGEHATNDIKPALESARRRLSDLVGTEVTFEHQAVSAVGQGAMPEGWIRLGLASHEGGAVVLAVDRVTATALARLAVKSDPLSSSESGAVLETGAEVVLRETLCALAAALGSAHEEIHHVIRLGSEAMVADLPHVGIEHDATWSTQTGHMRWLVPAHLVRSAAHLGVGRGGR
jgi:hypothetical protein